MTTWNLYADPLTRIPAPAIRWSPTRWANERRFLSPEDSAEPGKYRSDRAPYQAGIMDAVTEKQEVIIMSSAQVGKSLVCCNILGFLIDLQPCPILWIAPSLEMAEATSKDRIAPMLRDCPCFEGKVKSAQARNSGNTLLHKALDIETPIPTPFGWKKMGDIVVGDRVFDENGNPCNVTYVTPINYDRKCYKVVFSDGNWIVADQDHPWQVERWKVDKKGDKPKQVVISEVVTTTDLINGAGNSRCRYKYSIPVTKPLNLPESTLEIDPYVLGAWLGDGFSHEAVIVAGLGDVEEMRSILRSCGADGEIRLYNNGRARSIKLDTPYGKETHCGRGHERTVYGVTTDGHCAECHRQFVKRTAYGNDVDLRVPNSIRSWLGKLGLLKDKFSPYSLKSIPYHYLRASFEQRLSLLQGLMDTDGSIRGDGYCVFLTVLDRLAEGVCELLHGLGIQHKKKIRYPTYTHKGEKKEGKPCWEIGFTAPFDFDVFRLTRKLNRQKRFIANAKNKLRANSRRQVVDVVEVDSVPVRCIAVDSQNHLYLAGQAMIPTHNTFPGGHVTLAGANSPASLASRPVRVFIGDEIDRYPLSAGTEGDPVALAKKRTTTFWNRLIVLVSTPTRKGHSRIEKAWLQSDQRYFLLPCPHCGYHQHLKWENLNYSGKGTKEFDVSDIAYFCESCGCAISESSKPDMLRNGYWKAFGSGLSAGFHLNELVSPWKSWADVALDYEAAREDPNQYRVWYNTSLGLPLEDDDRTKFDWENLMKRAEKSDYSSGQIPEGALFLTAGLDRQGDRLEVSVYGWGEGEQSWLICHEQFFGDPLEDQVWLDAEDFLKKQYKHPLGGKISVTKTMVDSSYEAHDTYRQIKRRPNWVAIKGKEGDREIVPSATMVGVNYQGVKLKNGIKLYVLGVDRAKSTLLSRCKIETPGAKYLNVPADLTRFWAEGFAGSEVLLTKHRNGKPYYVWEKIGSIRNEPLDCAVYAFACAILCGVHRDSYNWARLRKLLTIEATIKEDKPSEVPVKVPPVEPEKPVRRSPSRMQRNSRFDY